MTAVLMLIPVALVLGGLGLLAFLWSMRSGQFDDLDGAANRILFDEQDQEAARKIAERQSRTAGDNSDAAR